MKSRRIISIIPARGESKGIPKKNVRLLAGRPLIVYTIESAKKSKYIQDVFVTTDDMNIANISKNCGAKIIKRPTELAQDNSSTIDVIFHALNYLQLDKNDLSILILLQPTSPLRNTDDIDKAVELFLNEDCESVISVCQTVPSPFWTFKVEDRYLTPLLGKMYLEMRRQDLPLTYVPNGAIYISRPQELYIYKSFYCNKALPYVMPLDRGVDIDDEIDFVLAEISISKTRRGNFSE
jgi:N-acylneuraminate cytidylyltransferase